MPTGARGAAAGSKAAKGVGSAGTGAAGGVSGRQVGASDVAWLIMARWEEEERMLRCWREVSRRPAAAPEVVGAQEGGLGPQTEAEDEGSVGSDTMGGGELRVAQRVITLSAVGKVARKKVAKGAVGCHR
eukprot:SAG11_NODE_3808_length_2212_cov_2.636536_1_plen_130_part_00